MMTLNYSSHANPAANYVSLSSQPSGHSLVQSLKARNINVQSFVGSQDIYETRAQKHGGPDYLQRYGSLPPTKQTRKVQTRMVRDNMFGYAKPQAESRTSQLLPTMHRPLFKQQPSTYETVETQSSVAIERRRPTYCESEEQKLNQLHEHPLVQSI